MFNLAERVQRRILASKQIRTRHNYKRVITYKVLNSVGKITTKVYIEKILQTLQEDSDFQGLTLCQDADSAHSSRATLTWAKHNDFPLLTLPWCLTRLFYSRVNGKPDKEGFLCAPGNY